MSGINRLVLNKKAVFLKEGGFLFGQKKSGEPRKAHPMH
jgi:hypothetical protein